MNQPERTPIFERVLHETEHLFRHHTPEHTSDPQPHPTENPAIISTSTPQEAPVTVLDDLKTDARGFVDKLENLDADAVEKIDAIKANPEAAAVLNSLAAVAKAELPEGYISAATSGLTLLEKLAEQHAGTHAEPAAPADTTGGPQVAGVA